MSRVPIPSGSARFVCQLHRPPLALPPYRRPSILRTLHTSIINRTIFVLWRAILCAAPAGAVIWLLANIDIAGQSMAQHCISFLDPLGYAIGLDGVILLAYVIAIPANEIVVPTILMLYLQHDDDRRTPNI